MANKVEAFGDLLYHKIAARTAKRLDAKLTQVKKNLLIEHRQLYSRMAAAIVDTDGPPNLSGWTPSWKGLSSQYKNMGASPREFKIPRSRKTKTKFDKGFFMYSGRLSSWLRSRNSMTNFGVPEISLRDATPTKVHGGLSFSGSINPYPKVNESIEDGLVAGDYIGYHSAIGDHVSFALDNFQGNKDRDILSPYLLWYMNTKDTLAFRRAVK